MMTSGLKEVRLGFLLVLLVGSCKEPRPSTASLPVSTASTIIPGRSDVEIADIRKTYRSVGERLEKLDRVVVELDGYAAEGARATGYFSALTLEKLRVEYFAESGYRVHDFYFADSSLVFMYSTRQLASQMTPELLGVVENRFYVSNGRLIRWVDDRGRMRTTTQPDAQAELLKVLEDAAEFKGIVTRRYKD